MGTPTTLEFLDLFAIPPASCAGFEADMQSNHQRFKAWAEVATEAQRNALWVLLKRFMLVGASIYVTATQDDRGLRIGIRAAAASEAEAVFARVRFPDDEPWIDLYQATIAGAHFPERLRLNLFDGDGLSPALRDYAEQLRRLVRKSELVMPLLVDTAPYSHAETRRRLAHRLPCSHPIGGLAPASAAATWREAWKVAPVTAPLSRIAGRAPGWAQLSGIDRLTGARPSPDSQHVAHIARNPPGAPGEVGRRRLRHRPERHHRAAEPPRPAQQVVPAGVHAIPRAAAA